MKYIKHILVLFIFSFLVQTLSAQTPQKTRILFLLDGSGSMWGQWDKEQKIIAAKRLLTDLVDSLGDLDNVELALRAYGHRSPKYQQDCKDTRLEVPFGQNNKEQIIEKLKEIQPKGTTPIAYSLGMAANDFPKAALTRNIIILITDGIEECDGDPCAVSISLQKRNVVLKPFIIGLGIKDEFIKELECMGNFFNAKDEKSFSEILNVVINNALNNTSSQVNLLDVYGKPTETSVNMTFYDAKNGLIKYNFYHTLNHRGNPDTLLIDPMYKYNMTVHTLPPVIKENVELTTGIHNVIAVDAPQGTLLLRSKGITKYMDLKAIVRENGKMETVHVQKFNVGQKYIVGKYDIEILTVPRIHVEGVKIKQSHTNTLEIPQPGRATFVSAQHMFGSIYQMKKGKFEWVIDINHNINNQNITMQPGEYTVVYQRKSSKITSYTNIKQFRVTSGGSTTIALK